MPVISSRRLHRQDVADLVESAEEASESEQLLLRVDASSSPSVARRSWKAIGASVLLLAGAGAGAAHFGGRRAASSGGGLFQSKRAQTLAKPSRDKCSNYDEDCWHTGCCNVVGLTCFQTKKGKGECLKNCTKGEDKICDQPKAIMNPILQDGDWQGVSLYCFSVVQQDHGSTKKHYDLELLQGAYGKKVGIFQCDSWGIFSDKAGEAGSDAPLVQVTDVDGDWHFAKRKSEGTWINTGLHRQAWKAIQSAGEYKKADWVVKVDCDAVFMPNRLKTWLQGQLVPDNGIYLENCQFVKYGYFGSLEIFSAAAFQTLLDNMDGCNKTIDWTVGVEGGKYGPMGEDLFAQACLDMHGVPRGEAFNTHTDGLCEADRPWEQKKNKKWTPSCDEQNTAGYHPMRKPEEYWACYDRTVKKFGQ